MNDAISETNIIDQYDIYAKGVLAFSLPSIITGIIQYLGRSIFPAFLTCNIELCLCLWMPIRVPQLSPTYVLNSAAYYLFRLRF